MATDPPDAPGPAAASVLEQCGAWEDHDLDDGVTIGGLTTCKCRRCGTVFEFGGDDD
jgi:hypothetical protein